MKRIMAIPTQSSEWQGLLETLQKAGFQVIVAHNSDIALRNLYQIHPDLIVMANDSAESRELCSKIRAFSRLPIIVIGRGGELARAIMLEMGADMYLTEPVTPPELVARVHALLRRYRKPPPGSEGLRFDPDNSRVEVDGNGVDLTPTEFRLLSCLVFNRGKVVSLPHLAGDVWGSSISLDTLHSYMRRLKQKLGISPKGPYRLLNYRGEGYCFCQA